MDAERDVEQRARASLIGETIDALIRERRAGAISFVSLLISLLLDGDYTLEQVREVAAQFSTQDPLYDTVEERGEQQHLASAISAGLRDIERMHVLSPEEEHWMMGFLDP